MPLFRTQKHKASTYGPTSIRDSLMRLATSSSKLTPADEMQVELASSQINHHRAFAERARQEAALLQQQIDRGTRRDADTQFAGASMAGVDLPQFQDFATFRRTGQMPSLTGETAEVGPIQPKYQWSPEQQGRMDSALAATTLGGQMKDVNPHTIAQARGEVQAQQLMDRIHELIRAGDYTQASAVSQTAKPGGDIKLFTPIASTGAGMHNVTGDVRTDNPLAQSTIAENYAKGNKPPASKVIQTDQGPMEFVPGRGAAPIMGPNGQPVQGKSTEKALPTSAAQKLMENQQNLRRAEQALALIQGKDITDESGAVIMKGDKDATGWKGFLPDFILQRVDEQGNPARASIADLGSLIIHDRSGAAVTAAEFPRLRPFIPQKTDDPKTVQQKLVRFVDEYRKVVQEAADFYRESGYKVPQGALKPSGAGGASGGWDGTERRKPAASAPKEGDTGTSNSGRPIIFRNGTWEYVEQEGA